MNAKMIAILYKLFNSTFGYGLTVVLDHNAETRYEKSFFKLLLEDPDKAYRVLINIYKSEDAVRTIIECASVSIKKEAMAKEALDEFIAAIKSGDSKKTQSILREFLKVKG
jgi:hypothetical protein